MIKTKIKHLLVFAITVLLCLPFSYVASQGVEQPTNITITAKEGLQFDLARFAVRPGANVKLIFKNVDEMTHNFIITLPGERLNVITLTQNLPAEVAVKQGYVPKTDKILFAIPAINPSESKVISFTAPAKEGVYPYVCTFPGHGYVMYGAMYVTTGKLPAIQNDPNVPDSRQNDGTHDDDEHDMSSMAAPKTLATTTSHPYKLEPPTLYRIFMPDASPAAIAVNLSDGISYCWDATTSRLRYLWSGGFLDNAEHWKGNGKPLAKILGTVFYRDSTGGALRMGNVDHKPVSEFKGYRLLNKYPQFIYTLDGADVTELITSAQAEGKGIIRTFTFDKLKKDLYFVTTENDGMTYSSTAGKWKNGVLKLSAKEARKFSITMVAKSN
ncbi:plastocyanin/azurin family copper-binding protein [Mucilaginibacter auburnensis]|uniref:Copper binding plastocyanin/azurin family protein n=1 Tax=Mucilaginibacter auburnensis TaxID=1457233 RepID=A0A2H9VLA5_9SPHI|nr:plastocyanin/azurin family copper-binding protein [Mucilaginibacter auburnensis]PJJ79120.1 copper binding plastocyanin/azurin family protein [Mucilaginibacter auburnensis]